jgi:hypothetical protein
MNTTRGSGEAIVRIDRSGSQPAVTGGGVLVA